MSRDRTLKSTHLRPAGDSPRSYSTLEGRIGPAAGLTHRLRTPADTAICMVYALVACWLTALAVLVLRSVRMIRWPDQSAPGRDGACRTAQACSSISGYE